MLRREGIRVKNDDRLKTVIFSGTTEGRELSDRLSDAGVPHTVCVATEYGEMMQHKGDHVLILEGRKDVTDMEALFDDGVKIVADATHPFATQVSENIKKAIGDRDIRYIRVLRECMEDKDYPDNVTLYDDIRGCFESAAGYEGNVLFTTGSKDIGLIREAFTDISRVYVRILPSVAAIEACEKAGIRNDHIIALHGPFNADTNLALIKQYDIACMVSKESGRTGGLDEKIKASVLAGIPCLLIRHPDEKCGVSADEAYKAITEDKFRTERTVKRHIHFDLIGMGMGSLDGMTCEAKKAVESADVIFGASRLIEPFGGVKKHDCYTAEDIAKVLAKADGDSVRAAVIYSGDIGLYSGATGFEGKIRELADSMGEYSLSFSRYPGISSVSALAARLGIDYSDAYIYSLHKKNEDKDYADAARKVLTREKSVLLLSSGDDVGALARALTDVHADVTITLAMRLSYDDEKIIELTLKEATKVQGKGLYIAYIKNNAIHRRPLIPYMEDEEFARNKTPMTKGMIRHEIVRLLNLKEGDVLYDVGSGTGSICIEAAALSDTLKVYSFEKDTDALDIQNKNIVKFGIRNIVVKEGEAPGTFARCDTPDSVFIGGSSGRLQDVLEHLKKTKKRIRVVITAVSIETMSEVSGLAADPAVSELKIEQISGSVAKELGDYHLMMSNNPVMIASFYLGGS